MFIVFAGPTIQEEKIREHLSDVIVKPPASTGDIYKAALEKPNAIGLIDGFFDGVPSVWHKEILWAIDNQIPVFGASSMGALRAAELYQFGMLGIGKIFEGYKSGILQDDDEVAIQHGPQEMQYLTLSEPMVNFRATLSRAVAENIISTETENRLIEKIKNCFYTKRTWETLFELASASNCQQSELTQLQKWLPQGRVDQKYWDAISMLNEMQKRIDNKRVAITNFDFQHTVMWEQLCRHNAAKNYSLYEFLLVDLIKLQNERYQDLRATIASEMGILTNVNLDELELKRQLTLQVRNFRSTNRLYSAIAYNEYLVEMGITASELEEKLSLNIKLSYAISNSLEAYNDKLIDKLKSDERYSDIRDNAKLAVVVCEQNNINDELTRNIDISLSQLVKWFFESLLNTAIPDDVEAFIFMHDFQNDNEFEEMLVRQYFLWQTSH